METYRDIDGDSGVEEYELGEDWINVRFRGGATYRYDHAKAGAIHVREMKRLARSGEGLNAYINLHVKYRYSKRL